VITGLGPTNLGRNSFKLTSNGLQAAGGFLMTTSYSPLAVVDLLTVNGGRRSAYYFGPKSQYMLRPVPNPARMEFMATMDNV
jgi:hypothetical protein